MSLLIVPLDVFNEPENIRSPFCQEAVVVGATNGAEKDLKASRLPDSSQRK